METKLTLVVALFIHAGREAEFEQFETRASTIMRRYGGAIERRIGIADATGDENPHEVHVVTFPDEQSYQRYRADAELSALAELRSRAIRKTTIWRGQELAAFQ
ncbi:MAG: DUF1330 domain-containing protein [Candidatus Binatus sp.]|uniref:DUF1330 domain-containing protein n=1 Tax=Candidatus Binatus sp. TaxID=2811406 RepID=UPI0027272E79|nr:DUF1330 domain-containing protein [Candidatus Binatus sp.]MDO8434714.1 DUF1330 domain-containing protein [Candidatus Binatus sp.]